MATRRPTEDDHAAAERRFLDGLAVGSDATALVEVLAELHPRNNTFPGETCIHVGLDALELAQVSPEHPIDCEGLVARHLPDRSFRGRAEHRVRMVILMIGAKRGGLEPDVLEEIVTWQSDDFWIYAIEASVAIIRECAARLGLSPEELGKQLKARAGTSP